MGENQLGCSVRKLTGVNNLNAIKRVWVESHDDPTRFTSWWIDSDADGSDYWEMSTLEAGGYFSAEPDTDSDILQFLRVQEQTIFISETTSPPTSTWENRFYFYNFNSDEWVLKMQNSFTVPASRQAVRDATYQQGSGIWAGILETEGDEGGPPDYGKPPVKKIVYRNRWVRVVDGGVTSTPDLDASNNWWIEPQSPYYHLFYRSQPVYSEFGAGSETYQPCGEVFLPLVLNPSSISPVNFADDFSTNTLASYQVIGTAVWQAANENVLLGNGVASDNRLYKSISFNENATAFGRVYIPDTGVGFYDTVAVALSGGGIEYWATLAYGPNLIEQNHISIMRNDVWGTLYPISLTPGWYTVKMLADYNNQVLWMKVWVEGTAEPDWQVSRPMDSNWAGQNVGFRHYGQGTFVDDLILVQN
jgi:hypothetical protein